MAIHLSNIANLVLFAAKVYASVESKSLAVIASTLDSLLDLLSGFILWFTAHAMKIPNHYRYPVGMKKKCNQCNCNSRITNITGVCQGTYCKVGLATAVHFHWWIDPTGAIIIALYTISTWVWTLIENVWSLIGRTAPPDLLAKLTYLIWNHHEDIQHIDTARAYTFGSHYFVEVDIVLPEDMLLSKAHNIGEKLQEKLELLPQVEQAFVHIDLSLHIGVNIRPWSHLIDNYSAGSNFGRLLRH
ncbi:hypothetical protein DITRI_Ditri12bG0003700 [Diplodiscus trichospermus]